MPVPLKKLALFNSKDKDAFNNYVVDLIIKSRAFNNIEYIGIAGSIGRGEKTIFTPNLNDIDFIVIGEIVNANFKEEIERKLCDITSTDFTDITVIDRKVITKDYHYMHQYLFDFIHGNIELYSTMNVSTHMKKLCEKKIKVTKFSIVNLFITRSYCLDVNKETKLDDIFLRYQLRKVILGYIDALLIVSSEYATINTIEKIEVIKKKFGCQTWLIDAEYYIYNYKHCDYIRFKEFTYHIYEMHSCMIKKECKLDLLYLLFKLLASPTRKKWRYTTDIFKLLFWRKR